MSNVLLREHDLGGRGQVSYGLGYWLTYVFAAPSNTSGRVGLVVVRQFGARRFDLHARELREPGLVLPERSLAEGTAHLGPRLRRSGVRP